MSDWALDVKKTCVMNSGCGVWKITLREITKTTLFSSHRSYTIPSSEMNSWKPLILELWDFYMKTKAWEHNIKESKKKNESLVLHHIITSVPLNLSTFSWQQASFCFFFTSCETVSHRCTVLFFFTWHFRVLGSSLFLCTAECVNTWWEKKKGRITKAQ